MTPSINQIDKLQVNNIVYAPKESQVKEERQSLTSKLKRALILGNMNKQHVKLRFKNADGLHFETVATIWGLTENYVILKGARMIPIHSLTDIIL